MSSLTKRPLFALGFRPFFLGASVYATLVMGIWALAWRGQPLPGTTLFGPTMWWHAHALIFGFAFAAVTGFLLTAVGNWTGRPTVQGGRLAGLFGLWATARILPHVGGGLALTAAFDLAFNLGVLWTVTVPLVRARRWRDVGIFPTKLLTLTIANALMYFSPSARRVGIYLGIYVMLAVVMTIGKRVFPMFIEKGLGDVKVRRVPALALVNLAAFVGFVVADLGWPGSAASAVLAACIAGINGWRWVLWARPGVWRAPLLWVLLAGYGAIVLGFGLKAASVIWPTLGGAAIHALTVGGIGLTVLGMMARVTLGHTGRNVRTPERPGWLTAMFAALFAATLLRIAAPLIAEVVPYSVTISVAQTLWILAFGAFVLRFGPMLYSPRADGKPG